LNNIGELDESVVKGVSKLLIDRARADNNMVFHFKMVKPEFLAMHPSHRFADNDQFTLYFDKYSSVADMMSLCDGISNYLRQSIPEKKKH